MQFMLVLLVSLSYSRHYCSFSLWDCYQHCIICIVMVVISVKNNFARIWTLVSVIRDKYEFNSVSQSRKIVSHARRRPFLMEFIFSRNFYFKLLLLDAVVWCTKATNGGVIRFDVWTIVGGSDRIIRYAQVGENRTYHH